MQFALLTLVAILENKNQLPYVCLCVVVVVAIFENKITHYLGHADCPLRGLGRQLHHILLHVCERVDKVQQVAHILHQEDKPELAHGGLNHHVRHPHHLVLVLEVVVEQDVDVKDLGVCALGDHAVARSLRGVRDLELLEAGRD